MAELFGFGLVADDLGAVADANSGVVDRFEVALAYARNAPAFATFDQKVYSGSDPSFYRIYRGDQGAIVVMSGPLAIGSADDVTIAAEGYVLGALFDEDAELVAVLHLPWYRRDTFLP